ncbi:hypothetical protein D3C81_1851540 [compost metagenome]
MDISAGQLHRHLADWRITRVLVTVVTVIHEHATGDAAGAQHLHIRIVVVVGGHRLVEGGLAVAIQARAHLGRIFDGQVERAGIHARHRHCPQGNGNTVGNAWRESAVQVAGHFLVIAGSAYLRTTT